MKKNYFVLKKNNSIFKIVYKLNGLTEFGQAKLGTEPISLCILDNGNGLHRIKTTERYDIPHRIIMKYFPYPLDIIQYKSLIHKIGKYEKTRSRSAQANRNSHYFKLILSSRRRYKLTKILLQVRTFFFN